MRCRPAGKRLSLIDRTSLARATVALPHSVISQLGPPGGWSGFSPLLSRPHGPMAKSQWINSKSTISWSYWLRWRTPSVR